MIDFYLVKLHFELINHDIKILLFILDSSLTLNIIDIESAYL